MSVLSRLLRFLSLLTGEGHVTVVADGLVVGVDTYKDVHVAVVLDWLGRRLAVQEFPATDAGNAGLVRWLTRLGPVTNAWGEGASSYGYRLAGLLADRCLHVWEVNCPDRSRRRRKGKSAQNTAVLRAATRECLP